MTLRLKTLQRRLENIFELINLWNQYIEVIYMPEGQVQLISQLSEMEGRPEGPAGPRPLTSLDWGTGLACGPRPARPPLALDLDLR